MLYTKDGKIQSQSQIVIIKDNMQIINPTHEMIIADGWVEYVPPKPTLDEIKERKIREITAYDISSAVNTVYLNDNPIWLDKDTRVGLVNSTNAEIKAGNETTTLWLGTVSLTFTCSKLLDMLADMELYALACFNRTAEHKRNVLKLSAEEEVEAYDFTAGYPEKPKFTMQ